MLEATQNVYLDRTATWHSVGKDASECANVNEVLEKSGLDYTVEKKPIFMNQKHDDFFTKIPNRFVTVRDIDEHPYDVVSDKFEVIQNRDAFDFVNYMGDEISFEKAGETESGMVYIIAKLPDVDILGDKFTPHVIFRNGFNGKVKITAAICPLRIICQNQFNFAFKNTQNSITIRHLSNAESKLAEAKEILKQSAAYMERLNIVAEGYAGQKLGEQKLERVIDIMFPMKGIENMNPYKRKTLEDARQKFINAYNADDNYSFRGTAWGLINAYTDFITHKVPQGNKETRFENRFIKSITQPMNEIINVINMVA